MTTAAQRLATLSGLSGASAGAHLRAIASGAAGTAAALLVAYSGLASATAAEHLLHDAIPAEPTTRDRYRQIAGDVVALRRVGDADPVMVAIGSRRRTH